jgi:predicted lipid carrier protein YhbT
MLRPLRLAELLPEQVQDATLRLMHRAATRPACIDRVKEASRSRAYFIVKLGL